MIKILALDLSTKSTGYAIGLDNLSNIEYGIFKEQSTDVMIRIENIVKQLHNLLNQHPDIQKVVIEEVPPKDGSEHTRKVLMWLQGLIMFELYHYNSALPIVFMQSSEWRKWLGIQTGKGHKRDALKEEDIKYAESILNHSVNNDDEADAVCILCAYIKSLSLSL